jgi:hypothetical protein
MKVEKKKKKKKKGYQSNRKNQGAEQEGGRGV